MKASAFAVLLAALFVLAGATPAIAAETDVSLCVLCHGTDARGNQAVGAPRIAGMEPWYLERQLKLFRANLRGTHAEDTPGHEMRFVAAALKDDRVLAQTVARVAALPLAHPAPTVKGNVERGAQLYASCSACHGARGEGNADLQAPALSGGSDWYQSLQLRNYLSGKRGVATDDLIDARMRAAVTVLADASAVDDVVAYIATLR